jgi:hypothetical protein
MGGEHGDTTTVLFSSKAIQAQVAGAAQCPCLLTATQKSGPDAILGAVEEGQNTQTALAMRAIAAVVILMVIGPLLWDVFPGALWDCERRKNWSKTGHSEACCADARRARETIRSVCYI